MEDRRIGDKIKVLIIFGGQSGEHDVSINSANSVIQALDINKYDIQTMGITKQGQWVWGVTPEYWKQNPGQVSEKHKQVSLVLDPQNPKFMTLDGSELAHDGKIDIVFPVLHGPKGEDGTIQGLFEMVGLPYVGSGVLGGSLGMDKDRMKAGFRDAGLPIVRHITVKRNEYASDQDSIINRVTKEIGYPCFVKPANLGSSVGISKAENPEELIEALEFAGQYDRKIVIEEGVKAREIELSVLGNDIVKVSIPGEIIPSKDFYDYEAKYIDASSKLIIPAILNKETILKLQDYAEKAFHAVSALGLGRVDFFVTKEDEIFVNEINTMPGFTQISMYPKLWEASGLKYADLLDELIKLGFERMK